MKLFLITFLLHQNIFANENTIVAARRLMDVFYQNCHASKKAPFDFIKSGELKGYRLAFNEKTGGRVSILSSQLEASQNQYLNCSNKEKNGLLNYLCENPPTYLWAGKGKFQADDKKRFDLFHNEDNVELMAKHPGLDCSGFINLSFLYAHKKVSDQINFEQAPFEISAREFMTPLSCFNEIKIEQNRKIHRGDVIAWNKHIVMIDNVSSDPFGINSIKSPEDCDLRKLNILKSKMVILNSKGSNDPNGNLETELVKINKSLFSFNQKAKDKVTGVGPGISKLYLSQLVLAYPQEILELIQTACLAKFHIALPTRKIKIVRHKLDEINISKEDVQRCSLSPEESIKFIGDNLECNQHKLVNKKN